MGCTTAPIFGAGAHQGRGGTAFGGGFQRPVPGAIVAVERHYGASSRAPARCRDRRGVISIAFPTGPRHCPTRAVEAAGVQLPGSGRRSRLRISASVIGGPFRGSGETSFRRRSPLLFGNIAASPRAGRAMPTLCDEARFTSRAGVTSKAGSRPGRRIGRDRTGVTRPSGSRPQTLVTSSPARSSIGNLAEPSAHPPVDGGGWQARQDGDAVCHGPPSALRLGADLVAEHRRWPWFRCLSPHADIDLPALHQVPAALATIR